MMKSGGEKRKGEWRAGRKRMIWMWGWGMERMHHKMKSSFEETINYVCASPLLQEESNTTDKKDAPDEKKYHHPHRLIFCTPVWLSSDITHNRMHIIILLIMTSRLKSVKKCIHQIRQTFRRNSSHSFHFIFSSVIRTRVREEHIQRISRKARTLGILSLLINSIRMMIRRSKVLMEEILFFKMRRRQFPSRK